MSEFAFRFRTHEGLLSNKELERQEIYFASSHQLNDPMEGHRNVVWQGDRILWRNLFRHYVRTLLASMSISAIMGEVTAPRDVLDMALIVVSNPPNAPIREQLDEVTSAFLQRPAIQKLAAGLADRMRPIGRRELLFYLRVVHFLALRDIVGVMARRGRQVQFTAIPDEVVAAASTNIDNIVGQPPLPAELAEGVYDLHETFNMQMEVIDVAGGSAYPPAAVFLVRDFPKEYIAGLVGMTYPEWHVACFVQEPTNASTWSAYANSHTGVCLKFRTTPTPDGAPGLVLSGGRSWTSSNRSRELLEKRHFTTMALTPVTYDTAYPEVPFFTSLGQMPMPTMMRDWFMEDGARSPVSNQFADDATEWRREYQERFAGCVNRKTPDWAHEKELRVDISSSMSPFDTDKSKLLKYRFEDLRGIIFGLKTPTAVKSEIVEIVDAKCWETGRTDFEFHQAQYSPGSQIEIRPLGAIKVGASGAAARS